MSYNKALNALQATIYTYSMYLIEMWDSDWLYCKSESHLAHPTYFSCHSCRFLKHFISIFPIPITGWPTTASDNDMPCTWFIVGIVKGHILNQFPSDDEFYILPGPLNFVTMFWLWTSDDNALQATMFHVPDSCLVHWPACHAPEPESYWV